MSDDSAPWYAEAVDIPERQESRTCRVCGKGLVGRQRAFCCRWRCPSLWILRFKRMPKWRRWLLSRDEYRCQDCRFEALRGFIAGGPLQVDPSLLEAHHIVARADGGAHTAENLVTLCKACHKRRHGCVVNDS